MSHRDAWQRRPLVGLIVGLMSRGKNKLTAIAVKAAGRGTLQDGGGLLLVKPDQDGGKWIFRFSHLGQRRDMGLGGWPTVSIAEARRARDVAAAQLAQGLDPISERNKARAEARAKIVSNTSLESVAQETFDARKSALRGDGVRGRWFSPLRLHVLPKLGKRQIDSIHQADIRDCLRPIWTTKPATSQKAIQRLRKVFEHARLSGLPVDPFTVDAAAHMLGELRIETLAIVATPWQDVPAVYAALDGQTASERALRWLILTAVRSDAGRGARVEEFDAELRNWTVPADRVKGQRGKVQPFVVPLSDQAQALARVCISEAQDGFLFPSYRRHQCVTSTAIAKPLNQRGIQGRPHGFRTSFRTWVQDTEAASFDVAETALGHRLGTKVERSYARSDLLEPRRALMAAWGAYVTSALSR